jgi:hypothetical protein
MSSFGAFMQGKFSVLRTYQACSNRPAWPGGDMLYRKKRKPPVQAAFF